MPTILLLGLTHFYPPKTQNSQNPLPLMRREHRQAPEESMQTADELVKFVGAAAGIHDYTAYERKADGSASYQPNIFVHTIRDLAVNEIFEHVTATVDIQDISQNATKRIMSESAMKCTERSSGGVIATSSMVGWRRFIARYSPRFADDEMRLIAMGCLDIFNEHVPVLFDDFEIFIDSDQDVCRPAGSALGSHVVAPVALPEGNIHDDCGADADDARPQEIRWAQCVYDSF